MRHIDYFNRNMHGGIDFDSFYLIAVTNHKGKEPFMLLAPKKNASHKYFNLRYGQQSKWYGTIDQALSIAKEYCGVSKFKCRVYRNRYYRLIGRKKNAQ